jgi:hypothetical protein
MRFNYLRSKRLQASMLGLGALLLSAAQSKAALITDPAGDFLPSYTTGPKNGDLDVLSAQVFFNGSSFTFTATMAGAIGTTSGGNYVWGINRGAGAQGFATIAPGVLFDAVFLINPAGGSMVRDTVAAVSTPITDISFSGDTITGTVPLSLLPSEGFAPENYLVNLWPRSGSSGLSVIADFAPDNSDAAVTSTPEPAGLALLGGAALAGLAFMRRRKAS